MPLWKQILLNLYYHASYPVRTWNYWREVSKDHLPIIILFYHRIADDRANAWTVSNAMFSRQIDWLERHFQLVSLEEAQRRIRQGYNHQTCISITFDDGYADNCQQAIPLLVKKRIPCTYFVTLQNVMKEEPFSHDLMLGHHLAPNNLEQLRAMAAAGVEIGGHAYTHADLGAITDPRLLHQEVVTAKEDLQKALGRPIRYFAFPYGQHKNLGSMAFKLVEQAGYAGACSAYGGLNYPGDDPFHLQRIAVDDNMIHLKNWVTMDPRKLHTHRFEYQEPEDVEQGTGADDCKELAKHP